MHFRNWIVGALIAFASPAVALDVQLPQLAPIQTQGQAANLSAQLLSRYAYKPVPLDDVLSEKILDRYIKSLDPDRSIFLQADIDGFMKERTSIDDAIKNADLHTPFSIFDLYLRRLAERIISARTQINKGFDFSVQEDLPLLREKEPWPQTEEQANDLWRKRAKNDWLRLKLAGQNEAKIRETLEKRYLNLLERIKTYGSKDVFQSFMTAYTTSIDPHTDYFGPAASADFDISMKLSLVGIGAVLQDRDGYATVRELVPGGPAQLSGKIAVGDRISGVGQGADGPITEVVGTRLDEVVQLIRGAKDSIVRLDILPADAGGNGAHRVISLVRDKVSLDKQAAKKSIVPIQDRGLTRKIGVITLPVFYEDFEAKRKGDANYRSASRDVAKLLTELNEEHVDGVLIDLRDNGGGSLTEAIELTGLFTGKGPVVQQRDASGNVEVESDDRRQPLYTGPVGVLINRGSASASEIFAAAIQDYGRGVIIGEPSFGKGTVQTVIDLDKAARNDKPVLGQLKLTIAQFFRVNGGTTQLRGVTPDISLPSLADPKTRGEASFDNALPWAEIKPASYKAKGDIKALLSQLQQRHDARVKTNPDFQKFVEAAAQLKAQREKAVVSLNEVERKREMDEAAKLLKSDKGADDLAAKDDGLQSNERSLSVDVAIENARKNEKDVLRTEAAAIVADEVDLSKR
ncbi:carboxy terminal-processing peptidase [Rhizobium oryzicola]|uniref:Carboxy terminal-processing peptidase n=1 Tax=Rhizobium oryzicola TaxID=1232668 RepID=A0ABT8SRC6_9HYPH|nr:carboxy terminal-processing peptidase [Rhizobium oryzicola]MDO1580980.1 carboxy terminal-processing peptidase [Rhizobium oryzicola]